MAPGQRGRKAEDSKWAIHAQNKDPDSSPFGETNQGASWMVKMLSLLVQGKTY